MSLRELLVLMILLSLLLLLLEPALPLLLEVVLLVVTTVVWLVHRVGTNGWSSPPHHSLAPCMLCPLGPLDTSAQRCLH